MPGTSLYSSVSALDPVAPTPTVQSAKTSETEALLSEDSLSLNPKYAERCKQEWAKLSGGQKWQAIQDAACRAVRAANKKSD
jgi:hypothetical protein